MKFPIAAAAFVALFATSASAGDPTGIWKSEPNDEGKYLEITMSACGDKICGVISSAHLASGEADPKYPNLGREIVSGMSPDGDDKWSDGKIWDPEKDKTYSSKMHLKGDVLSVEGCVFLICDGQDWTRVK